MNPLEIAGQILPLLRENFVPDTEDGKLGLVLALRAYADGLEKEWSGNDNITIDEYITTVYPEYFIEKDEYEAWRAKFTPKQDKERD